MQDLCKYDVVIFEKNLGCMPSLCGTCERVCYDLLNVNAVELILLS